MRKVLYITYNIMCVGSQRRQNLLSMKDLYTVEAVDLSESDKKYIVEFYSGLQPAGTMHEI